MSQLSYVGGMLLGILQGATEFLPISSSGHLAILQRYLGYVPDSPEMLLFDVFVHLATLAAVAYVFAGSIRGFVSRLICESRPSWSGRRDAWRIVCLMIAAIIPTGVIGLAFRGSFEAAFDRPRVIGTCLLITGGLLALTLVRRRQSRGWRRFYWWQAALVGFAQAGAILPGISRSGATICVATFFGLRRRWCAEFSFLIAAPAIAGGTLLMVLDVLALPSERFAAISWGPIIVGSAVSLVMGVMALRLLLGAVRTARLHYFAFYCWLLGGLMLCRVV